MNNCNSFWFWFLRPMAEALGVAAVLMPFVVLVWFIIWLLNRRR